jgi:hypothetical protein
MHIRIERSVDAGFVQEVLVMKKPVKHPDEAAGPVSIVADFLPTPGNLVFGDDVEKVTIAVSKRTVDFFKREARLHGTQYRRMVGALLDRYAEAHVTPVERLARERRQERRQ